MSDAGRILVIAPDEAMRLSLCFVLEAEGFAVGLAASALAVSGELEKADCIVIDDTALREAKAAGLTIGPCPVIVLAERPEESVAGPGDRLVEKPLLGQALIDLVEKVLPVRRMPDPATT